MVIVIFSLLILLIAPQFPDFTGHGRRPRPAKLTASVICRHLIIFKDRKKSSSTSMGLLSSGATAARQRSSALFIPRFFIIVTVLSLCILIYFEVDSFVSSVVYKSKTIRGHNLQPTPWHDFPPRLLESESKYSTFSTIFKCSYMTCGGRSSPAYELKQEKSSNGGGKSRDRTCPEAFRFIHRDLEPWMKTKITMAHLMEAQNFASFRVTIVKGKMYVELYYDCVQSRMMFTVWSFLQLLRRFPGEIPDVDLMFDCMDKPMVDRSNFTSTPLPLFRYCTTAEHFDIPFPDWSFWGWPEIEIQPWDEEFRSIKKGAAATSWSKKSPFAYWKGNPDVASRIRERLLKCNDTEKWKAQIIRQDWGEAAKAGFKDSKLSQQCNHQYKIYAEGYAWSVSLKYILSCGSVPLIISPTYQDFFSRGLTPMKNFMPINPNEMCRSIMRAVRWGSMHPSKAESIGKAAQDYMGDLSIDRVYDYMYHLLTEYSKLLDFKPTPPPAANEMCVESVICFADEKQRKSLERSLAYAAITPPCLLRH